VPDSASSADSAYQAMRTDLVTGELPPGDHLAELVLAGRYGVSRTPIREALRRLEQDGLVERRGRRMHVRERRPAERRDLAEVLLLLEQAAARGAANRHSGLDARRLGEALAALRALPADAAEHQWVRADEEFHRRLWAASRSPTLVTLLGLLHTQLGGHPECGPARPEQWRSRLTRHAELCAAVTGRRPEEAAALISATRGGLLRAH
jgi:DNA-binding GntR family transcriptional regulator